jgi:hypothetical protein
MIILGILPFLTAVVPFLAAAIWGGLCWRARGGGLTDATGWDPGTGGMRAIAAGAMALPLMLVSWHAVVLIPGLWIGWAIAGWGVFEGMGTTLIYNKPNPVASALELLGIARGTVIHDLLGMAIEGVICMIPPMLAIAGMILWGHVPVAWPWIDPPAIAHAAGLLWMTGIAFAPVYLLAQRSPWRPDFGAFLPGGVPTAFAELLVGTIVLPAILGAVLLTG